MSSEIIFQSRGLRRSLQKAKIHYQTLFRDIRDSHVTNSADILQNFVRGSLTGMIIDLLYNKHDYQRRKKIRPKYNALQGYLSQAPKIEKAYDILNDESQWKFVNEIIDSLNRTTGKSYENHKIIPDHNGAYNFVRLSVYRAKMGGLINYLHGEYFSDEPAPLSGNPSMVIHQNQSQQQSMTVTLLDMQDRINKQIQRSTDENEKSFLEKIKSQLSTATSFIQLLQLIITTANQFKIDISSLHKFFS